MSISVIVVNFNAGDYLRACIASLLHCPSVLEVLVVDNGSHDSSLTGLESIERVKLICLSENLGFAAACNIGACSSVGSELLFINPDCVIETSALNRLESVLTSDASIGMVGGLVLNTDGGEQVGGRRLAPTPWRSFVKAFRLTGLSALHPRLFSDFELRGERMPSQPIAVEAVSGACMLVKRAAVELVGLWDEEYFLHCEDLDWCMRFRQAGWKVVFVPDAVITHAKGVSSASRPVFVEWHKHKGMVRFYRKFFRHQYPVGLMGLVTLGVWLRFALVASYLQARLWFGRLRRQHG